MSQCRSCLCIADAHCLLHYIVVVSASPSLVVFVAMSPMIVVFVAMSLSSSLSCRICCYVAVIYCLRRYVAVICCICCYVAVFVAMLPSSLSLLPYHRCRQLQQVIVVFVAMSSSLVVLFVHRRLVRFSSQCCCCLCRSFLSCSSLVVFVPASSSLTLSLYHRCLWVAALLLPSSLDVFKSNVAIVCVASLVAWLDPSWHHCQTST